MFLANALHMPRPQLRALPRFAALSRKLDALRQALARQRAYLALMDEFEKMTDAEWADLGQSRLNARDLARQTVFGR